MMQVLITGGAGFFGRAFTKMLLDKRLAERVCIYSRDEMKHAQMQQDFGHDERLRMFIGDVRDKDRLKRAMHGIDLVVHAAALKRIQTGFYDPIELVKTNVMGAVNVIESSIDAGVKKIVALSTDKAFHPVSGYGYSKGLAESLFIAANNLSGKDGTRFAIVRYGNIAGSTGSVIPIWRRMIDEGKDTVPVSNPNVTRFWMLIDEATDLVYQTAQDMKGGELIVPTLPAFRLGDLADAMNVKQKITGLGEFEKMHESMVEHTSSEHARRMSIMEIREALQNV